MKVCGTLFRYTDEPSLKGIRCKHKNRELARIARPLFTANTGQTPEDFLRHTPDRSGWLQDRITAQLIVAYDPQPR